MTDALAYPEPPDEADLAPVLAAAGMQKVAERNARLVDPEIPPTKRLLTGARIIAGNQGADREAFQAWQADRSAPSPPRAGTDARQAKVLAAPDSLERGKALGGEAAATWLEATRADPIDVARFDRAPKSGRAAELWDKMRAGGLKDDDEAFSLADLVAKTGELLDDFDDDLSLGGGRVVDVGERVRVHWDDEPAPGVITALGLDTLPLESFDGDTKSGFDALVGDDIVVAAPVESQTLLRRAFPAASTGGTPRWLTVEPARVAGVLRAVESAGVDPAANVAVHLGGHPGLAPYDSLTFTTASDKRRDKFQALGAEHVGRGLVDVPRYKRRAVTADELVDAPTADEHVASTAWAIFEGSRDGGIPVRSGGEDFTMVFGVDPEEAAEASDGFVYVNDGLANVNDYEGLEPYSDAPKWFEMKLRDGSTYRFAASQDEALLLAERSQRSVDRWQIPVDEQNRQFLNGLAAHLERLDAEDVAAYVTGNAGEGFSEGREVLWADGAGNVAASRIAGKRSGPNVIPVWLRRNDGLPDDNDVSPDLFDTADDEVETQQVGSKWRVDATGTQDVAPFVRRGHALARKYGYDNVEVVSDRGKLELVR